MQMMRYFVDVAEADVRFDEADGLTCHANPFWSVRGVVEGWVAVTDSALAPWTSGSFFWFPEVR
jgi:hypothetical protein